MSPAALNAKPPFRAGFCTERIHTGIGTTPITCVTALTVN
jgi:hypothetical protein